MLWLPYVLAELALLCFDVFLLFRRFIVFVLLIRCCLCPQYMKQEQCRVFSVGQGTLTLRDRVGEENGREEQDGVPAESGGGVHARELQV